MPLGEAGRKLPSFLPPALPTTLEDEEEEEEDDPAPTATEVDEDNMLVEVLIPPE